MPEFSVGDLVILQYPDYYFDYDGVSAVVIAVLHGGAEYGVRVLGGPIFLCEPHQMRRPELEEEDLRTELMESA